MGLHRTAHYLKSKGRGEDTELVHMTKDEVKGLQALALRHGGSLTINPDTGLPEAGFLSRMLPTIAGTAVGAMTMNPFLGAAVAGGLTMATGGSLVQGIMSGIGAYGGAGMLGGLAEAGATQVAAEGAAQATQQAALTSGVQQFGTSQVIPAETGNLFLPGGSAEMATNIGAAMPQMPVISSASQAADLMAKGAISPEQYANFASEYAQRVPAATGADVMTMQNLGRGIGMGPQGFSPTTGITNLYDVVKKDPTQAAMTAAPMFTNMEPNQPQGAVTPTSSYASSISPDFRGYSPPQPNPYYGAQYPDYRRRTVYGAAGGLMADGGPVERMSAMNQQPGMYPQGMIDKTYYATPSQRPASMEVVQSDYDSPVNPITGIGPQFAAGGGVQSYLPKGDAGVYRDTDPATRNLSALDAEEYRRKKLMAKFGIPMAQLPKTGIKSLGGDFSDTAAKGGVSHLGDYSDGGRLLKGPGDGMSDNIPAMIGKKQPARLADGEFVVPADVVSHLGNGSTDAGAKKLYKMMDKIRAARTGKKKQAPAVKADRYMPA